jgi:hypothetical protein
MNREDVIRLAKEAGVFVRGHYDEPGLTPQELERFANLVEAQQSDRYKALTGELAEALATLMAAETNEAWRYPTVLGPIVREAKAALARYKQEQEKRV